MLTTMSGGKVLAQDLCRELVQHTPASDVNFKPDPGIVPADLNAIQKPVYDIVSIPITIDLLERFDIEGTDGLELEPDVANIQIHQDGRVIYNNQDITQRVQRTCGIAPDLPSNKKKVQKLDGQEEESDIISGSDNEPAPEREKNYLPGELIEGESY